MVVSESRLVCRAGAVVAPEATRFARGHDQSTGFQAGGQRYIGGFCTLLVSSGTYTVAEHLYHHRHFHDHSSSSTAVVEPSRLPKRVFAAASEILAYLCVLIN